MFTFLLWSNKKTSLPFSSSIVSPPPLTAYCTVSKNVSLMCVLPYLRHLVPEKKSHLLFRTSLFEPPQIIVAVENAHHSLTTTVHACCIINSCMPAFYLPFHAGTHASIVYQWRGVPLFRANNYYCYCLFVFFCFSQGLWDNWFTSLAKKRAHAFFHYSVNVHFIRR